ncbi:hypothetical protein [Blastomonas sp. CCH8-A3]|uniref:hypothetical protein n=1 Tax=Blastomonas sp. CCH8-A3 TaxID=1768743 RepID=UPI000825E5A1|nr:hypothetical protein [Blastomonas sp. CCH8-A3]
MYEAIPHALYEVDADERSFDCAILASAPVRAQATVDVGADAEAEAEIVVTGQFQQSLIDRIPIAPEELPFTLG